MAWRAACGLLSFTPLRLLGGASVAVPRAAVPVRALHASASCGHYCSHAEERAKRRRVSRGLPEEEEDAGKTVHGCRRRLKVSPQKLNVLAKQIRNLMVDDAITQMEFSPKKAASQIHQVLRITKNNAGFHHGIEDTSNLHVAESYVGKGRFTHGIRRANRGRGYKSDKPQAHYFLKLREGPPPSKAEAKKSPAHFTRHLIEQLERRPRKIYNSLE